MISLMLTGAARAEGIVVDLPIVGALVAAVTEAPVTVLAQGQADPHGLSLRPSQARALADADLVVHLGSGLSPALERSIADQDAPKISLATIAGIARVHDHDHDHDHGGVDPHIWLDPTHLSDWLDAIAKAARAVGFEADPAAQSVAADGILDDLRAKLPKSAPKVVVAHDNWTNVTEALGLPPFPAIADSHAAAPSAQHLRKLRDSIEKDGIDCILAAPWEPLTQSRALAADFDVPILIVDPQGRADLTGLPRYFSIFEGFTAALFDCQAKRT